MNVRLALTLVVLSGCAAAVPVAHHAYVESGGHGHAISRADLHARVERALDGLGLAAETRAEVERVLHEHFRRAVQLVEDLHAGRIDRDAAHAAHDAILASAHAALEPFLSRAQIGQLRDALHPEGCR